MNSFGSRLKSLRGSASQSAFAELLGIPQMTLSNYERGKNEPKFVTVEKICTELNVNADWLLFGRGPMRPGDALQPTANAPEPPVTPVEAATCARCAKLEAELEKERDERRELNAERRKLSELNIKLFNENTELRVVNGDLKVKCATLEERQKTCCPDPLPYLKKKPGGEGSPNCAQVCA